MGHLRERKDSQGRTRYQMLVEIWKGGRKFYKSKTFNTKREANAWESKIRHEITAGMTTAESLKNHKLSDVIKKYLAEVLPSKPQNARNVTQHLSWWDKQIGGSNLSDILPSTIAEYRDKLLNEPTTFGKKRAPATVVRYLCSLSSVFETAIREWHWIEKNPVRLIRKPTVFNLRTRFLTEEECPRLLTACKESRNPYLFAVVAIALGSGMRRGEILGLKWKDVDFDKKLITLERTKNGSVRYVPMVGIVYDTLKGMFQKETIFDTSFLIFPSINPGKLLEIRTAWEHALKRAGIKDLRLHDLRHTCASFLAMSGASQRDIAEILGHRDLKMTHRYSHLSCQHLTDALERATERFMSNAQIDT